MRYLGIDFGSKRVGLAISDEGGNIAFPYSVVINEKNLISNIETVIDKENIGALIIGESRNFEGKPNEIMKEIERFAQDLKIKIKIPIIFEQEFLSSFEAERFQGKTDMTDASAASIILQSYLDKKKNSVV